MTIRPNNGRIYRILAIALTLSVALGGITIFSINLNADNNDTESAILPTVQKIGDAVYAYSDNQLRVQDSTKTSSNNLLFAEVSASVINPLKNKDPCLDYYIFNVYLSASSQGDWSVTSSGFEDKCGESLYINVKCPTAESILQSYVQPKGIIQEPDTGKVTETTLTIQVPPFSFGTSQSFTAYKSETELVFQDKHEVSWKSAATTNGNPDLHSYEYSFALGVSVPKGQPANIEIYATANFYKTGLAFPWDVPKDTPTLIMTSEFIAPPIITIDSNPQGSGFVEVDGQRIITPWSFVWDQMQSVILNASSVVNGQKDGERYMFESWSDGKSQTHTIQISSEQATYTAAFVTQYRLDILETENGQIDLSKGPYWYNVGDNVNVKSSPNLGYQFRNWVLDGQITENPAELLITMDKPHTLSAVFAADPSFTLFIVLTIIFVGVILIGIAYAIYKLH